mgnify:CR=1 FL=1
MSNTTNDIFLSFINSLDDDNYLKRYINSNNSSSDFEKNFFISQLANSFKIYHQTEYNINNNHLCHNKNINNNKEWFKHKTNLLKNKCFNSTNSEEKRMDNIRNIASIIGELQIYQLLMESLFKFKIECKKEEKDKRTPDFTYTYEDNKKNEKKVNIEVATLLGTSNEDKLISSQTNNLKEVHPFSKPTNENENDLSGLISMINNIKGDQEQFCEKDINILAINLVSPLYKYTPFNFFEDRYKPYFISKCPDNAIYMGGLWQAFYSRKNDKIFYCIDIMNKIYQEVYTMPYNSRFNNDDKSNEKLNIIDFAIINLYGNVAIYQNLYRNNEIDKHIYRCLMSIENISYESVWINWPNNKLKEKVNFYRELSELYINDAVNDK